MATFCHISLIHLILHLLLFAINFRLWNCITSNKWNSQLHRDHLFSWSCVYMWWWFYIEWYRNCCMSGIWKLE